MGENTFEKEVPNPLKNTRFQGVCTCKSCRFSSALCSCVLDVKAFQHGKEITVMVFTGQKTEGAIQCDTSVQPGMTAEVVWLFELVDQSEVSVECSNGESYTITVE